MLAVIDETIPFVSSGVCYAAILLTDEDEARSIIRSVLPAGRKRPFHWVQEGPVARGRMIEAIAAIGVVAAGVVVPCGRTGQEHARDLAFSETIAAVLREDVHGLLIERRTPAQDGRDQAALLKVLRRLEGSKAISYSWETKSNELLWIADAIAGTVHDHLVGLKGDWYDRAVKVTGLTLTYRRLPPPS